MGEKDVDNLIKPTDDELHKLRTRRTVKGFRQVHGVVHVPDRVTGSRWTSILTLRSVPWRIPDVIARIPHLCRSLDGPLCSSLQLQLAVGGGMHFRDACRAFIVPMGPVFKCPQVSSYLQENQGRVSREPCVPSDQRRAVDDSSLTCASTRETVAQPWCPDTETDCTLAVVFCHVLLVRGMITG
jgi:hypothetical protein